MTRLFAFAAPVLFMAGIASAEAPVMTNGAVLTDEAGMTLYIFDRDEPGVSHCYDQCAANWPPFLATDGAMGDDDFSVVARDDGTMMWAYYGQPLYYWINDHAPGDMTGDGINNVWHVVAPRD